ncbi:MAG: Acg family FMN-binding oxidoreductase [Mycobacteriales bacterium]
MATIGSDTGHLAQLIRAAAAAPSIHNSQPWRFHATAGSVQICADRSRQLRVADPEGRGLLLSCGAAATNLQVAAAELGYRATLRTAAEPGPVATVDLAPGHRPSGPERLLARAIWRRHTNRYPFAPAPVPGPVRDDLTAAAAAHGARLDLLEPARASTLLRFATDVTDILADKAEERAELAAWVRVDEEGDDGVPAAAFGPQPVSRSPLRDFGLGTHLPDRPVTRFEPDPLVAVLYTGGDDPADWVAAGVALEYVLLTATTHELASSFLYQPVQISDLRWLTRPAASHAQMALRLGYPTSPTRPVHRRDPRDLLG